MQELALAGIRLSAAPKCVSECGQKNHEQRDARPVIALAQRQLSPLTFLVTIPVILPAPAHERRLNEFLERWKR